MHDCSLKRFCNNEGLRELWVLNVLFFCVSSGSCSLSYCLLCFFVIVYIEFFV